MRITCGGIILYLCVAMTIAGQSVNAQDRSQTRSMVVSRNGIVAAESPLAAQAGARILERGGKAVGAAIAANAMMGGVEAMMNGHGGGLLWSGFSGLRPKHHVNPDGGGGRAGVGHQRL